MIPGTMNAKRLSRLLAALIGAGACAAGAQMPDMNAADRWAKVDIVHY